MKSGRIVIKTIKLSAVGIAAGILLLTTACTSSPVGETSNVALSTGSWHIVADETGMTFITIHNRVNAEINTFRTMTGTVDPKGNAKITIDLNSIDSANETRDRYYRDVMFETGKYPNLTVTTKVNMDDYASLSIGDRHTELLDMVINLHGIEKNMQYYVMVTRLDSNKVLIENKAPLLLKVSDFNFEGAIAEMGRQVGVLDITPVATITLSLVLERS